MKSRLLPIIILAVFNLTIVRAQNPQVDDLKKAASTKEVEAELAEPDGASFQVLADGSWQIFGIGSGSYDFTDVDEISQATSAALMIAKKHIAEFIKGDRFSSEEYIGELSAKVKKLSSDGESESKAVNKDTIKVNMQNMRSSVEAILRGVVVLETTKIPQGKTSGAVHVKAGISSKSYALSNKIASDMAGGGASFSAKPGPTAESNLPEKNKNLPEKKKSKSGF